MVGVCLACGEVNCVVFEMNDGCHTFGGTGPPGTGFFFFFFCNG